MLMAGLIEEVSSLLNIHGLKRNSMPGRAIGYAETINYLKDDPMLQDSQRFLTYLTEFQVS
jgi:tRNA A37 N6-isopentenylltransferase MiaA